MVFFPFTESLFSRTFAVHRIRRWLEPVGAGGAAAVPCCSSIGWRHRHKRLRKWRGWTLADNAVQNDLQNEEGVGTSDVAQFFVTGPTDVATKPSDFYCRICRKDVSVLIHGHHEILRHFQGSKHFPRDQHLKFETPGWKVLDYEAIALSPAKV